MHRIVINAVALFGLLAGAIPASAQGAPQPADAPQARVGDSWRWVRSDRRTGLKEWEGSRTVTAVSADRIEAAENDGPAVLTGQLHVVETANWKREPAARFIDYPLAVGKKWKFQYLQSSKTSRAVSRWEYEAEVVGLEKVKVPAGEFDAFKVVAKGYFTNQHNTNSGYAQVTTWYAPAARTSVRTEFVEGRTDNVTELVELKLQP